MSSTELLQFLEGFTAESEHAVWQAVVIALRGLRRLVGDDAMPAFRSRVRDLVQPTLAALGEPTAEESDLTGKLRGLLVATAGVLGKDEYVIDLCREMLYRPGADVDPELVASNRKLGATGATSNPVIVADLIKTGRFDD